MKFACDDKTESSHRHTSGWPKVMKPIITTGPFFEPVGQIDKHEACLVLWSDSAGSNSCKLSNSATWKRTGSQHNRAIDCIVIDISLTCSLFGMAFYITSTSNSFHAQETRNDIVTNTGFAMIWAAGSFWTQLFEAIKRRSGCRAPLSQASARRIQPTPPPVLDLSEGALSLQYQPMHAHTCVIQMLIDGNFPILQVFLEKW